MLSTSQIEQSADQMLQIQHQIAADVSDNVLIAQRKKKEQFDKRQCFKEWIQDWRECLGQNYER